MNTVEIYNAIKQADKILIGGGAGLSAGAGLDYSNPTIFKENYKLFYDRGYDNIWNALTDHWTLTRENARIFWGFWATHINYVYYKQGFLDDFYDSPLLHFDVSEGRTNRNLIETLYIEYNKLGDHSDYDNMELISSVFQSFILSLKTQMPHNKHVNYQTKEYELFKEYRLAVEEYYSKYRAVEDYAKMLHVSKKTINEAVKAVSGMTAKQFIIERILLEIKRYLSQGELMNYEIADMLGFDAAANMTIFFKHYEGISPKEFRNQT